MNGLPSYIEAYLAIHGVSTIGAIIIFLIRNEHRLTKLETSHQLLKESHDAMTNIGTKGHEG